jgi:hypothetical protein
LDVAFAAKFQKCPRTTFFWVGFEIAFFSQKGQDVEVFLETAFVVEMTQDLLGAICFRNDTAVAVGAFRYRIGV